MPGNTTKHRAKLPGLRAKTVLRESGTQTSGRSTRMTAETVFQGSIKTKMAAPSVCHVFRASLSTLNVQTHASDAKVASIKTSLEVLTARHARKVSSSPCQIRHFAFLAHLDSLLRSQVDLDVRVRNVNPDNMQVREVAWSAGSAK